MPAECSPTLMRFARLRGRDVVADFGGDAMTSEAGALLLGATDRAIGLVDRFAGCFSGARAADRVVHDVVMLVGQRMFGIALGYEDLIDHDELRHGPALGVVLGRLERRRSGCAPLAGKSTLNRLEQAPAGAHRYRRIGHDAAAIEALFVDLFLDAHERSPERLVLDLDATDDPLHGRQEERFFHGYYDCYCYLPLYVFCGDHLLAAKLRRADIDASAGATDDVVAPAPRRRQGGVAPGRRQPALRRHLAEPGRHRPANAPRDALLRLRKKNQNRYTENLEKRQNPPNASPL